MAVRGNRRRPMTVRQRWLREARSYSVARLAADLTEDGYTVSMNEARGELVISGDTEGRFGSPVHFPQTDASLRRSLVGMAEHAAAGWTDVRPVDAAYRLLLSQVDATVAGALAPSRSHLPELPPGESYEYLSPEQYRERYGREPVAEESAGY